MTEPNAIVIIPASRNLAPASISLDAVSSGGILNSSYAILIAGDALPHNTQQNNAVRNVIGRYDHRLFFDLLSIRYQNTSFHRLALNSPNATQVVKISDANFSCDNTVKPIILPQSERMCKRSD